MVAGRGRHLREPVLDRVLGAFGEQLLAERQDARQGIGPVPCREAVLDRTDLIALGACRGPMPGGDVVGLAQCKSRGQEIAEQVVYAQHRRHFVERGDEQALLVEDLQHLAAVAAAGDGGTQLRVEIGEYRCAQQELLDVRRQDGSLLAFNDNISWPDNLNAEVYITPTYTGDMFLVVWSLVPAGSPAHKYILEVWPTTVPIFDSSNVETELNDTTSAADPITLPGAKLGMISVSGDVDWSYFDAPAGATVVVDVHSQIYGLHLDPVVGLFPPYGGEIVSNADMDGKDSRFNIVLPSTGRYFVRITDNANTGSIFHAYVLSVSLQDGSAAPHITRLKYTSSGRLKKVVGYNFSPPAVAVELAGTNLSIVPSAVNPTTVIKIKPPIDFPPVGAGPVTVVAIKGRRSNPVWPSAP